MLIVDGQVHLWAEDSPDEPWSSQETMDHRQPSPTADELLDEMDRCGVHRAVLVPPSWAGDTNRVALEAAAAHPDRFGVMGRMDLSRPRSSDYLSNLRAEHGQLGVRLTFAKPEHQRYLVDGSSEWLWKAAEAADLPVMVFAPTYTDELERIAQRHDRLRLVIDHVGLERGMTPGEVTRAFAEARRLAALPNVAVKASALPNFTAERYPFPSLQPLIYSLIESFGCERVFWGSDLTRLVCSYEEVRDSFMVELTQLSAPELEMVMGKGILAWLNWPLGSGFESAAEDNDQRSEVGAR